MIIINIFILFLILAPVSTSAQPHGTGMEGADTIRIDEHYIIITQDSADPNILTFEEQILYNNTGNEDYSGKLYTWGQLGTDIESVYKPIIVINGSEREVSNLQPVLNFLYINLSTEAVQIKSNETLNVIFRFILNYPTKDEFTFQRTYLYDNKDVRILINSNEKYKVEGKEGLELIYNSDSELYATKHNVPYPREFGDSTAILFTKRPTQNNNGDTSNSGDKGSDNSSSLIYYIILIIIICSIILVYFRFRPTRKLHSEAKTSSRKSRRGKARMSEGPSRSSQKGRRSRTRDDEVPTRKVEKQKPKQTRTSPQEERKQLIQEKKMILNSTARMKSDFKEGIISKDVYEKLKTEYKQKLKRINKKIIEVDKKGEMTTGDEPQEESEEMKKLKHKKEKILNAIKKLEDDKDSGVIDEDLFEEMVLAYKKQAIEILQEIDRQREK